MAGNRTGAAAAQSLQRLAQSQNANRRKIRIVKQQTTLHIIEKYSEHFLPQHQSRENTTKTEKIKLVFCVKRLVTLYLNSETRTLTGILTNTRLLGN